MDFTGKDLEDIQRVAGLLNLTVDELLEQSRARAQPTTPVQQSLPQHTFHQDNETLPWQHLSLRDQEFHSPFEYDDGQPGSSRSVTQFHEPHQAGSSTTVIKLLNPDSLAYDCDVGITGFNSTIGDSFILDDTDYFQADDEGRDGRSYVSATPMQLDSDSMSEHTTHTRDEPVIVDDVSTDWAIVPSPPDSLSSFHTAMSPSSGSLSGDKRYPALAPRVKSSSQSVSDGSSHRIRKKRSPYEGSKKTDTHLTRQVHACVRCRMQRNRCIPDPNNPRGPCLTCQQRTVRMSRLPCLRYMVTDTTLFRTGLDYMPFYREHPMIGPHYGDFHLHREWLDTPSKFLCLGQIGSMHFQVELKQFVPPANSHDVDLKGRSMYAVPWAIQDPDVVVEAMTSYIDRGITRYMDAYLDDTDELVWGIFQTAYRASVFPVPNEMLRKALKLWVACRFIESKWRCWAGAGWADTEIRASNPQDPFYKDIDSLPPYLDYQIASIIIHRILIPLRKDVLRDLQAAFNMHSPKDWFVSFLTSFILLQNYEMQMQFQRGFAARRQSRVSRTWTPPVRGTAPFSESRANTSQVQYLDMPLVRATNSGAKTILAHFHYCYKGQRLFTEGFNWSSPRVRRMARLDPEQTSFMAQCRDFVVKKEMRLLAGGGIHLSSSCLGPSQPQLLIPVESSYSGFLFVLQSYQQVCTQPSTTGNYLGQPRRMGAETILLEHLQITWAPLVLKAGPVKKEVKKFFPPGHVVDTREWPAKMEGKLAWGPTDFASDDDISMTFTKDELAEIRKAVEHFESLQCRGGEVTVDRFPLPTLGPKLWKAALDLHLGRGFVAIRGLDPREYTLEQNVYIFQGIASHIAAVKGRQTDDGDMLIHIRDAKLSDTPQSERPTRYSNRASTFHADTFCDILALQTLNNADVGGSNFIASNWTIYNKLMEKHPHVIDLLAQPNWGFDNRSQLFEMNVRPLMHYHNGRIIINFAREPLLGVPDADRDEELPFITKEQREALDLLEEVAKECQIKLTTQPGDLLFINNHGILHSREAFEDTPKNPRHLVRMWLKNEALAWGLPPSLNEFNSSIYNLKEKVNIVPNWDMSAKKKLKFKISERLTS
ncbi:hypothetical protein QBC35DRAFT_478880 [Podospora australis]|uniref:TauD/TfdA-like domain-containing protein n=1 Tax=Podospora australis TaxID=1536484 RepID=A0AAN7AE44_9PEZI|nr:hypothetical protein QBC35DRAFT_478880 [Podospora australis]